MRSVAGRPTPADFRPPPTPIDRARWAEADRAARPARLQRVRARMVDAGVEAFFGIRPEHTRYVTGLALGDGEERVAGQSGWFLVGRDEVVVLADSRYRVQAEREAPDARVEAAYHDLPERWPGLLRSLGARRVAFEAAVLPVAMHQRLVAAAPDVELLPVEGWIEADRAVKEPAEIDRIGAASAIADRALATVLPEIGAGPTEREIALRLEWVMRSGGGDGLAFDVACLGGPEAALPHGSPRDRPIEAGSVLLFDFGAQVDGYRSDMTRTLFVGEPSERDLEVYELVARAQSAAIAFVEASVAGGRAPTARAADNAAREVIERAGQGARFGHGTGHGIGLATHEEPRLSRTAPDVPLPTPTVFSVEPGVYLDGETGVRIEDLVTIDVSAGTTRLLTEFPRQVLVVG
jgi:Xaa-Pro aminopeptidase